MNAASTAMTAALAIALFALPTPVVASGTGVTTNSLDAYLARRPPKDVLLRADGSRVKTADEWTAEVRPAVIMFFDRNVYGEMPPRPAKLDFRLEEFGYSFDGAARRLWTAEIPVPPVKSARNGKPMHPCAKATVLGGSLAVPIYTALFKQGIVKSKDTSKDTKK